MFDLPQFLQTIGYAGITFMIFAESGLFFGFFFPGDSLLFTAGLLAAKGFFHLPTLIVLCFLGAVLGVNVGYAFGKRVGPKLFSRDDSFFFHKHHIDRAREFYARHGKKTIVLARFIPIVRTFAPIVAGVAEMRYATFMLYNVIGAALWAIGLPLVGFYLHEFIPNVDRYLLPIVAFIVILSVIPPLWHVFRERKRV